MNERFADMKYFVRFIRDRMQKIVTAVHICKYRLAEDPNFELERLDLEPVFRIRSLIPSFVFPEAVIKSVQKNPQGEIREILCDVLDYLQEYRAHMAGCCVDCWVNIYNIDEYSFILKKNIWEKAAKKDDKQFICIGCLEKRLKRKLKQSDFNWDVPLNSFDDFRSERLLARMGVV